MYNFASEFDVMQEHMGTPDDVPGENNNEMISPAPLFGLPGRFGS